MGLQKQHLGVPWTIDIIFHFVLSVIFFIFQFPHVFRKFTYFLQQKSLTWFLKRSLNEVSSIPKNFLSGLLSADTTTLYIMLAVRIIKIFKNYGLSIMVTSNITSVDFLDLTLNLKTESYQPFRKPNNDSIVVDINSNYAPIIHLKYWSSFRSPLAKDYLKILHQKRYLINLKRIRKSLNESGFYENLLYHQDNGNENQNKESTDCKRLLFFSNR